jgi:hypothetical protein
MAPGDHAALLRLIHTHLRPDTYVEIGVSTGYSFIQTLPSTLAIGIDPQPETEPHRPGTRLFAMDSDEFFSRHDLRAELGGRSVDVAFIDGMHRFEYALRDFMNLERFCGDDATILIHDCYPNDRESSAREPVPGWWSGDVWKLIVCLKQYRPDLVISVVDCPPTGLGIVTNLDPTSTVLQDSYDELCEAFIDLDYAVLDEGKEEKLNRVANDWELVQTLLPSRAPSAASPQPAGEPG